MYRPDPGRRATWSYLLYFDSSRDLCQLLTGIDLHVDLMTLGIKAVLIVGKLTTDAGGDLEEGQMYVVAVLKLVVYGLEK